MRTRVTIGDFSRATRNQRITAHLGRLEEELGQVQAATASLRDLLAAPAPGDISAGPIREYYLVGQHDTPDTAQWRTEIGWPIFQTSST